MSAAKRQSLAGLQPAAPVALPSLPARAEPVTPEVQSPEQQTPGVRSPEEQSPLVRRNGQRASRQVTPAAPLPKYRRLERKELLMWPGQLTRLGILARQLNRTRGGLGERITANTLIRVGIGLVLERARELDGTTEDELRQSLGLSAHERDPR